MRPMEPFQWVNTPSEFLQYVEDVIAITKDPEESHSKTDEVIEDLLCQLGYGEAVSLIRESRRWYS